MSTYAPWKGARNRGSQNRPCHAAVNHPSLSGHIHIAFHGCMPSTHTSLHYHLVFATKNREPWLNAEICDRLHHYLGGTIRQLGGHPHAVGGVADHVHVIAGLKAIHSLADVMREMKSQSSRWLREDLHLPGFSWQEGYGAFTFGAQDMEKVCAYALNQVEHHRVKTFQEEYVDMLKRGLVEYDDRFLW